MFQERNGMSFAMRAVEDVVIAVVVVVVVVVVVMMVLSEAVVVDVVVLLLLCLVLDHMALLLLCLVHMVLHPLMDHHPAMDHPLHMEHLSTILTTLQLFYHLLHLLTRPILLNHSSNRLILFHLRHPQMALKQR